jgi:hypothetical protein
VLHEAAVAKKLFVPEVAGVVRHVVHPGVGEVGEYVAAVEAGHGELGEQHLLEGGEGPEDALRSGAGAEAGGNGKNCCVP